MRSDCRFHPSRAMALGAFSLFLAQTAWGCGPRAPGAPDAAIECGAGTYRSELSAGGECVAWTECAPGSFVRALGNATRDTECEACPPGSFTDAANRFTCNAWLPCASDERVVEPASASTNWVCEDCLEGTLVSSTDPSRCEVASTCGAATQDWDHDGSAGTPCVAWTDCEAGSHVAQEGTSETDRACASCPGGTFSDIENADACSPWTMCPDGFSVVQAGTDRSDTVCASPASAWVREFGLANGDFNTDVLVEADGNVLIVGSTEIGPSSLGHLDGFMRRYSPAGDFLGEVFVATTGDDSIAGVANDADANIYVAGSTTGDLGEGADADGDAFVRKYSPALVELWTLQFGSTAIDGVVDVAVAPDGSVYLVGNTSGTLPGETTSGSWDAFVAHVSSAGVFDWAEQFGSAGIDQTNGLALDSQGALYVVGSARMALPGQVFAGGYQDAFLIKLASDGAEVWTHIVGTSGTDVIAAVGVDAADQVTIAGEVTLSLSGEPVYGMFDVFVRRVSDTGNVVWTQRLGTADANVAYDLQVEPGGAAFVVGATDDAFPDQTFRGGLRDGYVAAYGADGTPLWVRHVGTAGNDFAIGVATGALGSIFISGETTGTFPGETLTGTNDVFLMRFVP